MASWATASTPLPTFSAATAQSPADFPAEERFEPPVGVAPKAASDDAADVKLADAVRDLIVKADGFNPLLAALLDALGKSYSVAEINWDTNATPWIPASYVWRDPRYFRFGRESGQVLRLLDDANPSDGIDLPRYRFIVHTPRLKMGLPIRGGLARLCAVTWLCSVYIQEDWLSFAEVFGMPLRIGRFGSNASDADKDALKSAVVSLGSDAAAILHESMRIEFQAASPGAGGADLYERLLDRLDKLNSKAVLGRSDAADATSGKLGNEQSSSEVRRDILESDAAELAATVNAQLFRPFIDLNFGPQQRYPALVLDVPDQEDLAGLADMLAKLVPLGLKVEQSVIRDKWGLPDPAKDAELLGGAPALPAPAVNRAMNQIPPSPPLSKGGEATGDLTPPLKKGGVSAASGGIPVGAEGGGIPDPTAPLLERLGAEAEPLLNTMLDPIRAALDDSADLMDFRDKLLTLYPDLDGKAFANLMGEALAAAEAMGHYEARPLQNARNQPDPPPVNVTVNVTAPTAGKVIKTASRQPDGSYRIEESTDGA